VYEAVKQRLLLSGTAADRAHHGRDRVDVFVAQETVPAGI
jgi:hypothetical protein